MAGEVINIDGSLLEGGGQIIRIALSLSVLTRTPIRITKIRAGRSKPGLMEQHLKGLELVRDISNAKVKGAHFGSTQIEFWPGVIKGGNYKAVVKTAGSISLLLQVALPCTLFANCETTLTLQGGTNVEMAPQIDYTTEVFKPLLEKFGASFNFDLIKRGYFPKGGGAVSVHIKPVKELKGLELIKRGDVTSIYGWSFVAGLLSVDSANSMAKAAVEVLKHICNVDIEKYKETHETTKGNCTGIILVAETNTGCIFGGSALGKKTESVEETGRRAANELLNNIDDGGCVDSYCQDQIIIFMALANGMSRIKVKEVTMHTKTAIYVAELLTNAKYEIITADTFSFIQCRGIALKTLI